MTPYRHAPELDAVTVEKKARPASWWRLVKAWANGIDQRIGLRQLRLEALQKWPHAPRQIRTEWAICEYVCRHVRTSGMDGEHIAGVALNRFTMCEQAEFDFAMRSPGFS